MVPNKPSSGIDSDRGRHPHHAGAPEASWLGGDHDKSTVAALIIRHGRRDGAAALVADPARGVGLARRRGP